ncbi:MAG: hypothetical protein ACOYN0_19545, partial [Phycisphaerales bacterium]
PIVVADASVDDTDGHGSPVYGAAAAQVLNGPEDWDELRLQVTPAADPRTAARVDVVDPASEFQWYYSAEYKWLLLKCKDASIIVHWVESADSTFIDVERVNLTYSIVPRGPGTSDRRSVRAVPLLKAELPTSVPPSTGKPVIRGTPTGVTCKLDEQEGQFFDCGGKWVCLAGDLESQSGATVSASPPSSSNLPGATISIRNVSLTFAPFDLGLPTAARVEVFVNIPEAWQGEKPRFHAADPMTRARRTSFYQGPGASRYYLFYLRDVGWFFLPTAAPYASISIVFDSAPSSIRVDRQSFAYTVRANGKVDFGRQVTNAECLTAKPKDFP